MDSSLYQVAGLPPPPGVTPSFEREYNPKIVGHHAARAACLLVATIFFAIRHYNVQRTGGSPTRTGGGYPRYRLDDWTCLLAWVSLVPYTAAGFLCLAHGMGYHQWNVTLADSREFHKWLYLSSIFYNFCAFFTKTTLILLILRCFAIIPMVTVLLRMYIAVMFLYYLSVIVVKIIICLPIAYYWNRDIVGGRCLVDQAALFMVTALMSAVTDFIILVVPIWITVGLHYSHAKKLQIIALLSTGGLAVGLTSANAYQSYLFMVSEDDTENALRLDLFSTLEITIGIICACIPSVNMLVRARRARPQPLPHTVDSFDSRLGSPLTRIMSRSRLRHYILGRPESTTGGDAFTMSMEMNSCTSTEEHASQMRNEERAKRGSNGANQRELTDLGSAEEGSS